MNGGHQQPGTACECGLSLSGPCSWLQLLRAARPNARPAPRAPLQDIRGVRVWPGDLVRLARERPGLRIRADSVEDAWNPEIAGWQQLGPPPAEA